MHLILALPGWDFDLNQQSISLGEACSARVSVESYMKLFSGWRFIRGISGLARPALAEGNGRDWILETKATLALIAGGLSPWNVVEGTVQSLTSSRNSSRRPILLWSARRIWSSALPRKFVACQ